MHGKKYPWPFPGSTVRKTDLGYSGGANADQHATDLAYCANNNYWGNTPNLLANVNNNASRNSLAEWNSYIKYTDLTKTYPIYMLPLMETDTISIIITSQGSLKDPLEVAEGAEKAFDEALAAITKEIKGFSDDNSASKANMLNIMNTQGTGNVPGTDLESNDPDGTMPELVESASFLDYPSITGYGMNRNLDTTDTTIQPTKGKNKGIYYNAVNILVSPEIGPYEKYQIDKWRNNVYGKTATEKMQATDVTLRGEGTVFLDEVKNGKAGAWPAYKPGDQIVLTGAGANWDVDANGAALAPQLAQKNNPLHKPIVHGSYSIDTMNIPSGTYTTGTQDKVSSLQRYYQYLGMVNFINPGGAKGVLYKDGGGGGTGGHNTGVQERSTYLAHTISNEPVSSYYQKFITRSFTIKYKLDDPDDSHIDYNDIRISQLSADQVSAFEVKDDSSMPEVDIFSKDNVLRYDYNSYNIFSILLEQYLSSPLLLQYFVINLSCI